MKSNVIICTVTVVIVLFVSALSAHHEDEDEDDDESSGDANRFTFLSKADFQLASLSSLDKYQDNSNAPFEDPEASQPYYEGDMMISGDDEQRVAMYTAKRWPNGRIPYAMEDKFSPEERAAIARGIMTLQDSTCIKFVPRKNDEKDYVWMRRGPGCAAHVGRIGGQQWLFLGRGCFSVETVVHELMHAVGFIHEQSRPDRDAHVKIMWENIKDGAKRNFRKHTTDYLADHGFPYDLMSVMHYRQYAFSKNRQPTIMPRRPVPHLRCRGSDCPSDLDIRKINYLYKCKDGKSGFHGKKGSWESWAPEYSSKKKKKGKKKKSKKKGYGKRGYGGGDEFGGGYDFDNFIKGNPFYETLPVAPDFHGVRPPNEDLDAEYGYEAVPGYPVQHLAYDPYVVHETRQSNAVQQSPQESEPTESKQQNSMFSWITNLFHW